MKECNAYIYFTRVYKSLRSEQFICNAPEKFVISEML